MKPHIWSAALVVLFAAACNNTFEVGLEHTPAATAGVRPEITLVSLTNNTSVPPTTMEAPPSPTIPGPSQVTSPGDLSSVHAVKIFLIAVDDNGQGGMAVGCGDSAIPVEVEIQPTQAVLKAAVEALLALKSQNYGESGLYNALYQSDLKLDKLSLDGGKASVYLTGSLKIGGECDAPRVQAQLEQTVLQFSTVKEADIYINGRPLSDALSLR